MGTSQSLNPSLDMLFAEMPKPAEAAPPAITSTTDHVGDQPTRFAREDHTHQSRVQRATATLDNFGRTSWMFTRPFDDEPNIPNPGYRELFPTGLPIVFRVVEFYREKDVGGNTVAGGVLESDGGTGRYSGIMVQANRLINKLTPQMATVATVKVLTGVSIDIASGMNLAGIKVYLQAAPNS